MFYHYLEHWQEQKPKPEKGSVWVTKCHQVVEEAGGIVKADAQFKSITGKDAKSGRIVTMIRTAQMFTNDEIVIGGKSGSPAQHGK